MRYGLCNYELFLFFSCTHELLNHNYLIYHQLNAGFLNITIVPSMSSFPSLPSFLSFLRVCCLYLASDALFLPSSCCVCRKRAADKDQRAVGGEVERKVSY